VASSLHAWLIEHDGRRILVDTGETAGVRDLPFARYQVAAGDELPRALASIGLGFDDLDTVIVTHLHSDHADGAVHVRGPVLVSQEEWAFAHSKLGGVCSGPRAAADRRARRSRRRRRPARWPRRARRSRPP
jgi:glyoxylase-like metal-dependent hydrolase (beta-lactamase superfamily II)